MDLQELVNLGVLSVGELTATINDLPRTLTRISELGLFQEAGTDSTFVKIGLDGTKLVLVPNVPRGAPSQPKALSPGNVRVFETCHLPQRSTVMADSLQNLRVLTPTGESVAAGAAGVQQKVTALQRVHRRDLDYTMEYHRLGALRGQILDADGSVIIDLYTAFGVTQPTEAMALGTSGTKVRNKALAVKRKIEVALGGVPYTGVRGFASPEFFEKLIGHADVEKAYERYNDGAALRDDVRRGFAFGGVIWEEIAGGVGSTPFIPAGEAIAFPEGVPDMFITRFAPADYIETVNTVGLPYYSKTRVLDFEKGIELESQSNPLNINTRPGAVVRLTTN